MTNYLVEPSGTTYFSKVGMGAPAHDRKVQAFTVGLGASPLRTRGCVRVTDPRRPCQQMAELLLREAQKTRQ